LALDCPIAEITRITGYSAHDIELIRDGLEDEIVSGGYRYDPPSAHHLDRLGTYRKTRT
jgi:hypothetical protein